MYIYICNKEILPENDLQLSAHDFIPYHYGCSHFVYAAVIMQKYLVRPVVSFTCCRGYPVECRVSLQVAYVTVESLGTAGLFDRFDKMEIF